MGATAGHEDAADGGSTDAAGLACALVNAVLDLEKAALAVSVNVVRNRGPAETDSVAKDTAEFLAKALEFCPGEAASSAAGSYAGAEEAFVSVNVSNAGEQCLVK